VSVVDTTAPGHHVGAVDDFELGRFRVFELAGRPVGVVRTEDGFYAVRNRCPHQGADICGGWVTGTHVPSPPGSYTYSEERMVVQCPWHRWEFDLATGESVEHVAAKRLVTYAVSVQDGEVYVQMKGGRTP
jgi:3-phenylpropionate/trans-cinnamate dioxygenase ferredoxin subunit